VLLKPLLPLPLEFFLKVFKPLKAIASLPWHSLLHQPS